jgi:cytochrome c oxidase subunit 3
MSLRAIEQAQLKNAGSHHDEGHAIQHLAHQFEDLDQQNESYVVGMWTFLVTEIMFFGALFLAYSVYRVLYFETYLEAHKFLSIPLGTVNTFVLLTSSLAMALGVHAAQVGKKKSLIGWLLLTVLLSFVFLGVKCVEYGEKFHERLYPGPTFDYMVANAEYASHHPDYIVTHPEYKDFEKILEERGAESGNTTAPFEGSSANYATVTGYQTSKLSTSNLGEMPYLHDQESQSNRAQLFFSLYFAMTGLHAIHIIIGIILMLVIAFLASRNHPAVEDFMPTEMVGLYWHFVDIVWIFLFPMMYLIS